MNVYDNVFTFENLLVAESKAAKNKRHKKDVIEFESELTANIYRLYQSLRNRTYKVSGYNEFEIYEPKKRSIQSLRFFDRIVQHCFVDHYLGPLLEKHLIYDNAACRKGKGTDFARNRLRMMLDKANRGGKTYILQMDVHKYFPSIDHEILKSKLTKLIKDDEMLSFSFSIIDSFNSEEGKGLPMGNQTSQCFALYYLDEMDRVIKERHQVKGYVRYMDDAIVISNDKEELKNIRKEIECFLEKDKLEINKTKTHVFPYDQGVSFLGFRFSPNENGCSFLRLSKGKKRRVIRFLWKKKSENKISKSAQSYLSFISRAKEHYFKKKIISISR